MQVRQRRVKGSIRAEKGGDSDESDDEDELGENRDVTPKDEGWKLNLISNIVGL